MDKYSLYLCPMIDDELLNEYCRGQEYFKIWKWLHMTVISYQTEINCPGFDSILSELQKDMTKIPWKIGNGVMKKRVSRLLIYSIQDRHLDRLMMKLKKMNGKFRTKRPHVTMGSPNCIEKLQKQDFLDKIVNLLPSCEWELVVIKMGKGNIDLLEKKKKIPLHCFK